MEEQRKIKEQGGAIAVQNPVLKWLDNYWYHYKWHTIVVAFFIFVGIVCFAQCSSSVSGDLTLTFCGNYTLTQEERVRINDVFEAISPKKEDGKATTIMLNDYAVYTEEELRAIYTDEDGNLSVVAFNNAKAVNSDHLSTFGTFLMTGESAIWLVSEFVFEERNLSTLAVPLTELFETVPASAVNDYAIRLGDTELYQYYDALKVLPADTLLVMPAHFVWGESSNQEKYDEFRAMYNAIVNFKKPQ
ncbi:MAG: hypothetical protein E7666_05085 [Ruminococcaceae bacterium]|nr:hypothetical protein [Oscillospiraceae bacterium]